MAHRPGCSGRGLQLRIWPPVEGYQLRMRKVVVGRGVSASSPGAHATPLPGTPRTVDSM
jgi:hypothetical protein